MGNAGAMEQVLEGLQTLILQSAKTAAGEQYSPQRDADVSDSIIGVRKAQMKELREIRERFENLMTGVIS